MSIQKTVIECNNSHIYESNVVIKGNNNHIYGDDVTIIGNGCIIYGDRPEINGNYNKFHKTCKSIVGDNNGPARSLSSKNAHMVTATTGPLRQTSRNSVNSLSNSMSENTKRAINFNNSIVLNGISMSVIGKGLINLDGNSYMSNGEMDHILESKITFRFTKAPSHVVVNGTSKYVFNENVKSVTFNHGSPMCEASSYIVEKVGVTDQERNDSEEEEEPIQEYSDSSYSDSGSGQSSSESESDRPVKKTNKITKRFKKSHLMKNKRKQRNRKH